MTLDLDAQLFLTLYSKAGSSGPGFFTEKSGSVSASIEPYLNDEVRAFLERDPMIS
jgi:hypothetical protein